MKRWHYILILILLLCPMWLRLYLLLYSYLHVNNRSFIADCNEFGYCVQIKEEVSIIGALPPICRIISYSDPLFFVYDRDYYYSYKPKSNNIHLIKLWHNIERTDIYELLDITKDSIKNVGLKELKKE